MTGSRPALPGSVRGIVLAGALLGLGCAHLAPGRWGQPEEPTAPPPAAAPQEPAAAPATPEPAAPPADRVVRPKPPERVTNPAPSDSLAGSAPPPAAAPPAVPVISEDLPPAERVQLEEARQRDLEQTANLLQAIEAGPLSAAAQEKLQTIRALMQASREAADRSEIREAASLAHKAWILATELPPR